MDASGYQELGRIGHIGHRITSDRHGQLRGVGWDFVHVCIDDCSRVAYAEVLRDPQGTTVAAFLRRADQEFRHACFSLAPFGATPNSRKRDLPRSATSRPA